MKIEYIELENFRQFKEAKINFSTDDEKNVTILMGNNGSGKTTLAQAFSWCLYGETSFKVKDLLNKNKENELENYLSCYIKVRISLEHSGKKYLIERKQAWQKRNKRINKESPEVMVLVKNKNGETKTIKESLACENEIKNILPPELSKYFFFDGERIEKMSKEVQGGKRADTFAEAVRGLLGLNVIASAIEHLGNGKRSVIGEYEEKFSQGNNEKLVKNTKILIDLKEKKVIQEKSLKENAQEKAREEELVKEYNEKLKEYEESAKFQKIREKYIKERMEAEKRKDEKIKSLIKDFNKYYYSYFLQYLLTDAIEKLEKFNFEKEKILIPGINMELINYLIDEKVCICGRKIFDKGEEYQKLLELKKYLEKSTNYNIKSAVGNFILKNKNKYNSSLYENIMEKNQYINDEQRTIDSKEESISNIDKKLSGKDVEKTINEIARSLTFSENRIKQLDKEKEKIFKEIGEIETKIKLYDNIIKNLTSKDEENKKIELYRSYATQARNYLNEIKLLNEEELRESLEEKINNIFKMIYEGGLSLDLDENYGIRIHASNQETETSTAQSISVILAFISGIIELAREYQNNEKKELASEPYPLVMDAPLSAFDKLRIKNVCKILPNIAEQVIIFIKDTDGDLARENLASKIGKINVIKKLDEFNSVIE